jgi:hypothetical protein
MVLEINEVVAAGHTGTRWGKRLTAAAAGVVAALGAVVAGPSAPAEAAATSCWRATHQSTVKKVTVAIHESGFTYRWCASKGKVTGFVVESWHSVIRNWVWASDPRGDIRPTMSLGQDRLHIYGDFSAKSTVTGTGSVKFKGGTKVDVSWTPGRIGTHYEIDLYPNGTMTGQTWKG